MSDKMDTRQTMLLEEYKLCQASANRFEDTIWKTFSVIGIIAIAPLVQFVSKDLTDHKNTFLVFMAGLLVVGISWIWWKIALRWWDLQHITFQRMADIEGELEYIYQIRYINFKDGRLDVEDSNLSPKQKEELQEDREIKKKGVKKSLRWFPGIVTIVWIIAIIYVVFYKL